MKIGNCNHIRILNIRKRIIDLVNSTRNVNVGTSGKHVLRKDISVLVALGVHNGHRDCAEHCILDMAASANTAARVLEKFASRSET